MAQRATKFSAVVGVVWGTVVEDMLYEKAEMMESERTELTILIIVEGIQRTLFSEACVICDATSAMARQSNSAM